MNALRIPHRSTVSHNSRKIQPLKKVTSRNLLPALHQKTHFKSLVTIYNEYPQGSLNGKGKRRQFEHHEENETAEELVCSVLMGASRCAGQSASGDTSKSEKS